MKYNVQAEVRRGTPLCAYIIAGTDYYNARADFIPLALAGLTRGDGRFLLDRAQTLLYSMVAEVTRGGAVVSSLGS